MRDTIFISHATPEDNDFTIWLASRLKMLGYEVWIDKNGLIGGEKFWEDIDQVIRNKAVKILLVYSNNICQKDENGQVIAGKLKDGIYKEFSLAESIGKQNKLSDFIILMNIDKATYNLFIGADRLNQIPFYDSWGDGFKQLEKKLNQDQIPKSNITDGGEFGSWYENQFLPSNGITSKYELYYSNWWAINKLPDYFYIYQFKTKGQVDAIVKQQHDYPAGKNTNHLSSFHEYASFKILEKDVEVEIKPQKTHKIKVTDILIGFDSKAFPTQRDSENFFKQLLKNVFHTIMRNRGMFWYEMANKQLAYFYTPANLTTLKVKFDYPFRETKSSKTKNLIGKYTTMGQWHFGMSVKPILSPILGFSLKNHIVFTEDGFKVWKDAKGEPDKAKIHSHRRSKGKRLFNEEWRDMQLAFIHGLKKDDHIKVPLSADFLLEMPTTTETYWADFGYYDPKDKTRQGILGTYEEPLEETDD